MDPAVSTVVAGLLAALGALLGVAVGRYAWPAIRGGDGDCRGALMQEERNNPEVL